MINCPSNDKHHKLIYWSHPNRPSHCMHYLLGRWESTWHCSKNMGTELQTLFILLVRTWPTWPFTHIARLKFYQCHFSQLVQQLTSNCFPHLMSKLDLMACILRPLLWWYIEFDRLTHRNLSENLEIDLLITSASLPRILMLDHTIILI